MRKIREVLRLKFDCGLSVRKIAERLAVSVSTVSSYLKDAPEPKTGVFGVGVLE